LNGACLPAGRLFFCFFQWVETHWRKKHKKAGVEGGKGAQIKIISLFVQLLLF